MGTIVDKRDELPIKELLLLLRSGYVVSYESSGLATMFTKTMTRHQAAMAWAGCVDGRFVVREAGPSPKTAT